MADETAKEFVALGDRASTFPSVDDPHRYTSARIKSCLYETLAPLGAFTNLRSLEVSQYPDRTFEPLSTLVGLERLKIRHMPALQELIGIESLTALQYLYLATLPSWDASGRVTVVRSLAPLADLPNLTTLRLFGVRPPDKRVDDLLKNRITHRCPDQQVPAPRDRAPVRGGRRARSDRWRRRRVGLTARNRAAERTAVRTVRPRRGRRRRWSRSDGHGRL